MPRIKKLPRGMWKRAGTYYARFRLNGRLIRKRLSTDFQSAAMILNDLRSRADRGDYGLVDNDYSWSELKTQFLSWARQAVRNPKDFERDLKHFEAFTAINSVAQLDPKLIFAFREWRLAQAIKKTGRTVTPRTVNREVGTLHNMLNKAVKWGVIGFNPLAGIKPLRHDAPTKTRRALRSEEVQAIFAASPDYLRPVWRLYATTGIRRRELVNLRFADVDFERRMIVIRASTAKSGKAREIPLDDEALSMIGQLRDGAAARQRLAGPTAKMTERQAANFSREHVFVSNANTPLRNNLLNRFYAICKRAGIDDAHRRGAVDIHSLRVTFTTLALENGASPKAVQAILGHATLAMTMGVYAKATEHSKRDAISALPFASSSAPEHLISVQMRTGKRTSPKMSSETKAPQLVTA